MKKCLSILLLCFTCLTAAAQKSEQSTSKWYIGLNPLSYAMAFPLKEEIKRYGPVMAGNEYGLNLVGGYYIQPKIQSEVRLSMGNIHQVSSVGQVHAGINYHLFFKEGVSPNKGFYTGLFVKYWDYHNQLTHIHFYNVSPYATVGHQWNYNKWMVDLRMNQSLAVHSWTSQQDVKPGTAWFFSPWPSFIPVLPTLNLTVGYKIIRPLPLVKNNHPTKADAL